MYKQKCIKIYWNMNTNQKAQLQFSKTNCWYGNIIIRDDGYFEGIVKLNRKNENNTKHLVFGIINNDIEIIYKINQEEDSVHIYRFQDGNFIAIDSDNYNEFLYGQYKIEIGETQKENYDNLINEINMFKESSEKEDLDFYNKKSKYVMGKNLVSNI